MTWTRRQFLGRSLAVVPLLGARRCTPPGAHPEPARSRAAPATPDPLLPLLAAERDLLHRYDQALLRFPELLARFGYVRPDHDAHVSALRAAITGPEPSGSPGPEFAPATPAAAVAALRIAETEAVARFGAACIAARGGRSALLGSIAACEASHLMVLR